MRKEFLIVIVSVLFLLILSLSASAVSFTGPPRSERKVIFEPGLSKTFEFFISDAARLDTYLAGDLLEYVTLDDPDPEGGPRTISVTITFPDYLPSGNYQFFVGANEVAEVSGTVGGLTSIQAAIDVFVFREEKYLEFQMSPHNTNVNESTKVEFTVSSFTKQKINSVQGFVKIYNDKGDVLAESKTDSVSLASGEITTINAPYYTTGFVPSTYTAKGWLVYDGIETSEKEGGFKVGDLNVRLVACPKKVYSGGIRNFPITIQNGWNGRLKNVYADVRFTEDPDIKFSTLQVVLEPFEKKQLDGYLDTSKISEGEHEIKMTVKFADDRQLPFSCNFSIVPEPVKQEAQPVKKKIELSMIHILLIVIILLILVNVFFLVILPKMRQKKEDLKSAGKDKKSPGKASGPGSDPNIEMVEKSPIGRQKKQKE
ncbi:hypothetical protein JXC34_03930 [Candidatus Woesearchaeota archaeon]|nr:hypothetical protein [Candidatus Woesearchaeota archaeon]